MVDYKTRFETLGFHSRTWQVKGIYKNNTMEENNVQFNPEVSRTVFDNQRRIDRCLEHISSVPLVDENEVASRNSDFQVIHRVQKRKLP